MYKTTKSLQGFYFLVTKPKYRYTKKYAGIGLVGNVLQRWFLHCQLTPALCTYKIFYSFYFAVFLSNSSQ